MFFLKSFYWLNMSKGLKYIIVQYKTILGRGHWVDDLFVLHTVKYRSYCVYFIIIFMIFMADSLSLKMNGIFANYLWTMFWGSVFWIFWIMWFFPRKYKYRCKDEKHVIWMWIWLILKNISLLDRIWNLWLVRFTHSPPNFIFWLGRLIFSVSINSHPDNIYLLFGENWLIDFNMSTICIQKSLMK